MASVSNSSKGHPDSENLHLMSDHFEAIGNEDEANHHNSHDLPHATRRYLSRLPSTKSGSMCLILTSVALVITLLSVLALYLFHPHQPSESLSLPGIQFGSCGDSPSSARLANCTFDVMSFSWLPFPCADPELTEEFLSLRNWTWLLDANKTATVPFEMIAGGDYDILYVTREYHMYHCTYMWRKLHRGLLKGRENVEQRGIMDTYIGSYEHTSHCEMMLLEMKDEHSPVDRDVVDTAIVMKFPRCMWM